MRNAIAAISEGLDGEDASLEDVIPECQDVIHDDEYEQLAARALLDLASVNGFEE